MRHIGESLGMPLGTTKHHLRKLEASELIVSKKDGRFRRHFPANSIGREEKAIVSALRRETVRRIVRAIAERKLTTIGELCLITGFSNSTVAFYVRNLERDSIVQRVRHIRGFILSLKNPQLVEFSLDKIENEELHT